MGNHIYKKLFYKKVTPDKSLKRISSESRQQENHVIKRFRSTFDYLYQKLFIEGEGSDITVKAFDRSWKLHKLYINQSPFFASMFTGGWSENNANEVCLEFSDSNITPDSLDIIFGSFYYDSLKFEEENIIAVLAASIWFQIEDIRQLCEDFILKNLKIDNVVSFYDIGILYEIPKLTAKCIEWISSSILLIDDCESFYSMLRSISPELMLEIIKNPKLFVIQIEQDVFLLLLKWFYLKMRTNIDNSTKDFSSLVYNYFKGEDIKFSDIPGLSVINYQLFQAIRWDQIISTYNAASSLTKFSIIPQNILSSVFKNQWLTMLKSNEVKTSSNLSVNVNAELFWKKSERCGRKLVTDSSTTWRWNMHKYGVDIVVRYTNREFYLIRYIDRQNCPDWMKHVPEKRQLQVHLSVASYYLEKCDEHSFYPVFTSRIESGIMFLELLENIPVKVLSILPNFEFPLILSANILRYNPNELLHRDDSSLLQLYRPSFSQNEEHIDFV